MIHLRDFSYRFRGSKAYALRDLTLDIERGEFAVIAGPSGSGKSTLALALGGFLFSQYDGEASGSVHVNGLDARHTPIYELAEVVGLVQQNPETQFCTLTVQDELAFGLENCCLPPEEIRARLAWALDVVGARHLEHRALATLSGGEKQRVAIAAMLATRPQVLIFDEPTSNLDPSATAQIFEVIARIRAEDRITVIVIEHKLDYLRQFAPRWLHIEGGRLQERAPIFQSSSNRQHPHIPTAQPPLVRIAGLHAEHERQEVLHDISLEIQPGEFVAVMGDNGSGKSTFLQCLLGLHQPSAGQLTVLGHDPRRTPVSQLARQVAYVFQNPDHQLFAQSVWDEATLAPRNFGLPEGEIAGTAASLLTSSGLHARRDEHPYRLSYGEKRRLTLVAMLTYQPRLLLLDEILIGQDPRNAEQLLTWLRERVAAGSAVVLVNHAPEITRRYATRLLFFEAGRLTLDAPTEAGFAALAAQGRRAYLPATGA